MALHLGSDGTVADPTLVLMTRSGSRLGPLLGFENFHYKRHLNQADEISLTVHKTIDGELNPLWDNIVSLKVLWYTDANECFELDVDTTDDDDTIKQITGTALAESELSQIYLFDTEINTENDIAREDYTVPTVFYNVSNPSISLLDRVLNKAPHYTVKHVDSSLKSIQRTFSFDNKSVADALNEIAEEVKCIFIYDSSVWMSGQRIITRSEEEVVTRTGDSLSAVSNEKAARTISAYDLMRSCRDCGKRFEGDSCPKCGSTDFNEGYGRNTGIVVSKDNLADNIDFSSDTDSVKNCFRLEGGDDEFTALIRSCNPNGSNYIWNITDEMKSDMSTQLVQKIDEYDVLYEEYATTRQFTADTTAYNALVDKYISKKSDLRHIYSGDSEEATTQDIKLIGVSSLVDAEYSIADFAAYLQSSMMPTYVYNVPSAQEQCNTIQSNITTISVTNVNTASAETVALAIKSLAKIYAHTEIYNIDVKTTSYSQPTWRGIVTLTNYSDDTDTASTTTMTVTANSTATNYATELVQKKVNEYASDAYSISSLFDMSLSNFKTAIKDYSLDCLKSFDECCQACISVLVDQGAGASGATAHSIYTAYYKKLKALETEIKTRSNELTTIGTFDNRSGLLQTIISLINNVHKALDFETYLGTDLWNEFTLYRREQEYTNSNYRSDGLTNAEMIQNARGFYEAAEAELYKASHLQYSISAPLANLLAMPEFSGLTDNFDVGNWIYVLVEGKPYRLRLVTYEIDFDNIQNIDVEFSDLIAMKTGVSDLKSVIDSQKSMSHSYGTVAKQAQKGDLASQSVNDFYATGINGAKIHILSNETSQDMQFGDSGLLGRKWLDDEDRYSDEQCRMTNSTLAFTDDGWETCRAAIGKIVVDDQEKYGIIADNIIGTLGSFVKLSADSITSGSLTVYDTNGDVIFSADKTNRSVTLGGWTARKDYLESRDTDGTTSIRLGGGMISGTTIKLVNDSDTAATPSLEFYPYGGGLPGLTLNATYYSGGRAPSGYIWGSGEITIRATNTLILEGGPPTNVDSYSGVAVLSDMTVEGDMECNSTLIVDGGNLYVDEGDIYANGGRFSGTVRPTADGSYNLGTSSYHWNNVYTNNVNGYPPVVLRTKTITDSTSTAGNISLGVNSGTYGILSVMRTDANSVCTPYVYHGTSSNIWYAHITSSASSPVAVTGTSVTLTVIYFPYSS